MKHIPSVIGHTIRIRYPKIGASINITAPSLPLKFSNPIHISVLLFVGTLLRPSNCGALVGIFRLVQVILYVIYSTI